MMIIINLVIIYLIFIIIFNIIINLIKKKEKIIKILILKKFIEIKDNLTDNKTLCNLSIIPNKEISDVTIFIIN